MLDIIIGGIRVVEEASPVQIFINVADREAEAGILPKEKSSISAKSKK
jgi:hypothetical protein